MRHADAANLTQAHTLGHVRAIVTMVTQLGRTP